jgi:ABC-type transporter Mla subunit MlaD
MPVPSNHFKLGLFVVVVAAGIAATILVLGARILGKETVRYHTYFNESVQGLEVGAPVKFRGVTIGSVAQIGVAPDRRHVDVVEEISANEVQRAGLVHPDHRAQIGGQGITGVKFIAIDFFDPKANPPPSLPFPVPSNYIPAAPSMMKNLEDTISKAMDKLPDLVDAVVAVANRVDRILGEVADSELMDHASSTLARADEVLGAVRAIVAQWGRAELPEKVAAAVDDLGKTASRLELFVERIDGDAGLVTSVRRASDAVAGLGRGAGAATRDLDQTLREVRDAAESVRHFTEDLDRDPDMLLKGRRSAKGGRP